MTEWGSGRASEAASDGQEEEEEEREPAGGGDESPDEAEAAGEADETETSDAAVAEKDEEPRPSRLPIATWLLVVILIAVVLVTYSALRIAGEQRYQSCVQAVSAQLGSATDSLSRLVRTQSVKRCSHSPL
jgi:hypothetical protein